MEHRVFVLFPTFEHQNAAQIEQRHEARLQRVVAEAPGAGFTTLTAWAEVTDAMEVTSDEAVRAIAEFSVFSPAYAVERLQWRPKKPLHVLVLRVHRLATAIRLDLLPAYGGCKSWIDLESEVALQPSSPALDPRAFEAMRGRVLARLPASG
jgi:hypothetical protein